jgi:DNA polymerase-3 subunit gamma/tau
MDLIKSTSKTIWAMLDGSQVTEVAGSTVVVAVAPSLAKRLAEDRNSSLIANALTRAVGGTWRIDVVPGGAPLRAVAGPSAPPAAEPDPRDDTEEPASGGAAAAAAPRDPEAEALRLLHDHLGARPVEAE